MKQIRKKIKKLHQKIIDWWKRLPKREKNLIMIFIAIIPIILYFIKIEPTKEEVNKLKKEKRQLQAELLKLKKEKKETKKLKKELAKIELILKEAERYLPSKKEIASLLTEISKEQEKFDIIIVRLKTEKEIYHDNIYAEIPFQLAISGSFRNTMLFLDNLRKKDRLLNIENLSIEKNKENLLTQCKISTYRFLSKKERELLKKKTENKKQKGKKR